VGSTPRPTEKCDFDFVSEFVSWKPVSVAQELQLKGESQREQEPLDTEAATKQRSEDRDDRARVICKV
jgi:hypothetical protein